MPVYEYECGACGHQFEEWQKITDKPVRTCPKCKAKKVDRLISQTAFHLKGGGWYSDLYSTSKKGSSSEGSGSGGGDKGEGTKASSGDKPAETKSDKSDKSDKPAKTPSSDAPKKKDGGKKAAAAA
jgi:putative FmdB family regulatory protein